MLVDVDKCAVANAPNPASSIVFLQNLFMAKNIASAQVLQLILDFLASLAYLPCLLINGITEVVVSLNNCLHDQLTLPNDVESRRRLSNIVNGCTFRHS